MSFPLALKSTVDRLEGELSDIKQLNAHARSALRKIASGQTEYANSTVKRLCNIARDALLHRC